MLSNDFLNQKGGRTYKVLKNKNSKMAKNRFLALAILLISLSYPGEKTVMAEEYVKDIKIIDTSIVYSQYELPRVADLCVELKNNGDKKIANLNFEVSYYDTEGYPMKKVVLKNKLTEAIPPGEARKYKIRLNGDVFNDRNEEYPFSRSGDVGEFDVKILNVKFARK